MTERQNKRASLWHAYRAPLIIGIVCFLGLIYALLVEGSVADGIWGLIAGFPVFVTGVMIWRSGLIRNR